MKCSIQICLLCCRLELKPYYTANIQANTHKTIILLTVIKNNALKPWVFVWVFSMRPKAQ